MAGDRDEIRIEHLAYEKTGLLPLQVFDIYSLQQ
jgi:hypothetical protein